MNRGKQIVKKGIWHIGGKRKRKRKQKGGAFPIGLVASLAGLILGEVAKPIFKKYLAEVKKEEKDGKTDNNFKKKSRSKTN